MEKIGNWLVIFPWNPNLSLEQWGGPSTYLWLMPRISIHNSQTLNKLRFGVNTSIYLRNENKVQNSPSHRVVCHDIRSRNWADLNTYFILYMRVDCESVLAFAWRGIMMHKKFLFWSKVFDFVSFSVKKTSRLVRRLNTCGEFWLLSVGATIKFWSV